MLHEPSVSPPSLCFHSLPAAAGVRKMKEKKKIKKNRRAMWRQANLKAIIDHQPPWLVWLQCARCNWLGTAIRSFNRKYTLSLSISFKKWQHWGKAALPLKQQFTYKNWIPRVCHSNSDPCNQTKRFPPSYTYKVAQNVQQSLFQYTERPAASSELLESSIKGYTVYFASQGLSFFL